MSTQGELQSYFRDDQREAVHKALGLPGLSPDTPAMNRSERRLFSRPLPKKATRRKRRR